MKTVSVTTDHAVRSTSTDESTISESSGELGLRRNHPPTINDLIVQLRCVRQSRIQANFKKGMGDHYDSPLVDVQIDEETLENCQVHIIGDGIIIKCGGRSQFTGCLDGSTFKFAPGPPAVYELGSVFQVSFQCGIPRRTDTQIAVIISLGSRADAEKLSLAVQEGRKVNASDSD